MRYGGPIVELLKGKREPLSVEEIRRECNVSNWSIALSTCLQLMIEGKIRGMKTSRGWSVLD